MQLQEIQKSARTDLLHCRRRPVLCWKDWMDHCKKIWTNPLNTLLVKFPREIAHDTGGLRREFLSSKYQKTLKQSLFLKLKLLEVNSYLKGKVYLSLYLFCPIKQGSRGNSHSFRKRQGSLKRGLRTVFTFEVLCQFFLYKFLS